jgi:hypothetical protein
MIDQPSKDLSLCGRLGSIWGVAGVSLLLSFAVYRLSIIAIDAFSYEFEWYHWLVFIGNSLFMAHSEGYKGFQKGFSPRVAARARYIRNNPRLLHVITAPLFCMGYFYTTRKRLIVAYGMTLGIVILVIVFNQISQPWRGILDAGVVVGLSWGIASLLWFSIEALGSGEFSVLAETPVGESSK